MNTWFMVFTIDDGAIEMRVAATKIAELAIADSAQATLAIVAVASSAVAVPLDPKLTTTEVERCLNILRPSAVLVLRHSNPTARSVAQQRGEERPAWVLQLARPRDESARLAP